MTHLKQLGIKVIAILSGDHEKSGGLITPVMGALVRNIGSVLVVLSSASLGFLKKNQR
jgi:Cd2+/Zn2+-exporting ATPase